MFKKVSVIASVLVFAVIAVPASVFAHVTVKPAEVATAARQTFNVSVPNESDTAEVVGVRLIVPEGLKSARPNAKPGWKVELKKEGEGESAKVTEINWTTTGGTIPVGLRDDFFFGAQAPAEATEMQWKAYETYSDGKIVAWDQAPKEGDETIKPYSVTKVVKDLDKKAETGDNHEDKKSDEKGDSDEAESRANMALAVGALGLIVGAAALYRAQSAKK